MRLIELLGITLRETNRKKFGIKGTEFYGFDIWIYDKASFLLNNGLPITGILKIVYPCYSKYEITHKALKNYLASYSMVALGNKEAFSIINYERCIKEDLEASLGVAVSVKFHTYKIKQIISNPFFNYLFLEGHTNVEKLPVFSDYKEKNKYDIFIDHIDEVIKEYRLRTSSLKLLKNSGTFFGYYCGPFTIKFPELLKKIISLRLRKEMETICCEKLFIDTSPKVGECMVSIQFSEKESLTINPIRAISLSLIPANLININIINKKF